MKNRLLIFAFLGCLIVFAGCRKDDLLFWKPRLKGSWELRDIQGGFRLPGIDPVVTPGNGNILKFTNSEYQFYSRGQLTSTGTYKVTKEDTYDGAYPANALTLNSEQYPYARFSIKKNILTIYAGTIAADGYIAKYARQ